ncbi:hypothetical protein [Xylocopilactobacillus apis]|uniref:ABC-2 family transporter protein n=1 Tax=Xylocopilactobacillus apis TaxID=2932183 RepID=A0AAU9CTC4_9LACO|nr:hypothetical protein [Xylocopilactobacillus apis]BDR55611.1 hypothetical protein KIMC2_01730 [Xylocopilactobacillus apis]
MKFIRLRFFHQRYQLGLLLGLIIIVIHICLGQIPDTEYLNGVRINHVAIFEWIGFDLNMVFPNFFYLVLPILCSLGPSLAITEDLKSGFASRMTQFSFRRYLIGNLGISFLWGAFTVIIPLLIDCLTALWLFPNVTPNLIASYGLEIVPGLTYGAKLFYQQPFLLVLGYIILGGITGGIYALISVLSGIISRNLYLAASTPLILVTIVTLISNVFPKFIYSPTYIMMPSSQKSIPPLNIVCVIYSLIIVGLIGGIWNEFKHKIVI